MTETSIHPHVPDERAEHFTAVDSQSTEDEYLELLAALVRVAKPRRVLETGAYAGGATVAMSRACRANGFGLVESLERDADGAHCAWARVRAAGLADWATVRAVDSIDWLRHAATLDADHPRFDFAFLDSDLPLRVAELTACVDGGLLTPGAVVAIHDSSRLRTTRAGTPDPRTAAFWEALHVARERYGLREMLELPLSRGMVLLRASA